MPGSSTHACHEPSPAGPPVVVDQQGKHKLWTHSCVVLQVKALPQDEEVATLRDALHRAESGNKDLAQEIEQHKQKLEAHQVASALGVGSIAAAVADAVEKCDALWLNPLLVA